MITFANSEDPAEMQHNAVFHQGFFTVCKGKKNIFRQKNTIFFKKYSPKPLDKYNGLSTAYNIKPEGKIHLFAKG